MPTGIYERKSWDKARRKNHSDMAKRKHFGIWMTGRKQNKELIQKRVDSRKGYRHSKETKEKIKKANTGHKASESAIIKNRLAHLGLKHSDSTKQILREISLAKCKRGKEHPCWNGGISKVRYPSVFNNELKLSIRSRDEFKCCKCGKTEQEELKELNRVLCVNHIDYDKKNCDINNLNTLCLRCNLSVNKDRPYWTSYFKKQIIKI